MIAEAPRYLGNPASTLQGSYLVRSVKIPLHFSHFRQNVRRL